MKSLKMKLNLIVLLIMIVCVPAKVLSQNVIQGVVTDKTTQEPLTGASVVIKGTSKGSITDANGNYTLQIPSGTPKEKLKLVFSYLGYIAQEIPVENAGSTNIALVEDINKLDEVVVVGYGSVRRSDLTGSVSSINAKTLKEANVSSFAEAIQGRIAGVRVNAQSGEPGGSINIEIRGANSINAGTAPLYVIDGIPMDSYASEVASSSVGGSTSSNPLSIIAPEDIESMEILKDASAAAIYGARGANGVIIITTKSGKASPKVKFTVNSSYGISQITKGMDMLNAQEYVNYRHELAPTNTAFANGTLDAPKDVSDFETHKWQDELFRNGSVAKINLSMQGGNDKTVYSGGFGVLDQKALVENNDYRSYTGRFKLDTKASEKLSAGLSANWGKTLNTGLASSGGGSDSWTGLIQSVYTFRPILLASVGGGDDEVGEMSLSTMIHDAYRATDYNRIIGSAYVRYKILKNLSLKVTGGGNYSSSKLSEFYGSNTLWGKTAQGRATLKHIQSESYNTTSTLDYWTKITRDQVLKLMGGFEANAYKYQTFQIVKTKFEDQSTGVFDISKGSVLESSPSNVYDTNRMSFFGRLNYDVKDKYLLTATLRADGSSNFGEGKRFGYFPSMALAWRISQEDFMKNITPVSNLKLRLSYGVTGNDRITAYQSMATLSKAYYSGNNGNTLYGVAPVTAANPDLKWETTSQYNGGLDLGLFDHRISITADVYYKKTTDMLLETILSSQTGFPKQWKNIGDMENKGLELTLNTVNFHTKDFEWSTSINYYQNRNKVLSLGGVKDMPVVIGAGVISQVGIVREGEPLGTAYGYIWDGIYQINDFTWKRKGSTAPDDSDPTIPHADRVYTLKPGVPKFSGVNVQPGELKYKDLDESGTVDSDDRRIISNSNPKFSGGFSNEFRYKNFSLNVFFEGVYGNEIFNSFPTMIEAGQGEPSYNLTRDYWYNRWTPENPTNRYGSLLSTTDNLASTYFVEDGSFLRFKTLSIGYSLNKKALNFLKITSLKFYGTVDNLYVWTKYRGLDPDVRSSEKLLPGYDRLAYPRARTFTFGFDLTF